MYEKDNSTNRLTAAQKNKTHEQHITFSCIITTNNTANYFIL